VSASGRWPEALSRSSIGTISSGGDADPAGEAARKQSRMPKLAGAAVGQRLGGQWRSTTVYLG